MKQKNQQDFSIIDKGVTVDGTYIGKGNLIVKGVIKGQVNGENVTIAEEGQIIADMQAVNVTLAGKFEGVMEVGGELSILASGQCNGKVCSKTLVIESGGVLNAEVNCDRSRQAAQAQNEKAKKADK